MNIFKLFAISSVMILMGSQAGAQDWAGFKRYQKANEEVGGKPKAVLMGDSITDGWATADPQFFTDNNFVGRGISGQCTSQMLVRFRRDVLDLKPKYVVILAGVNDIAQNPGSAGSVEDVFGNIVSMCEIAKANRIRPVLCTATPAAKIPWRAGMVVADEVRQLNALISDYAKKHKIKLIDYYTPMAAPDGDFPREYSYDGIHPTLAGYKVMEKLLLDVVK